MSAFEVDTFLDSTTTDAGSRRPPIPAGINLIGEITDIKGRVNQGKKDPSKTYTALDVQIKCQVTPELVADGQPETVVYTDGILLDLTPDGRGLDWAPGKNTKLTKYRMALDMNTPGQAFSPRQMIGRMLRIQVAHEAYQGEIYDRVGSVAKV